MNDKFHIEVSCQQKCFEGERICGDVFLSSRIKEENRVVAVLSDGMGHGVKANVLATLTATMALNFTKEHKEIERTAEIIMNTLPVCSDRHISYATFTIVDIEMDGMVHIMEYDNPHCSIIRGQHLFTPNWKTITMQSELNKNKQLRTCNFYPRKEDRIVFWSDGVAQSGMGSEKYPFGWGVNSMAAFAEMQVNKDAEISAPKLASKVVNMAHINDFYSSKDDTSCVVIYLRDPRKLLICTGPPFNEENDKQLGELVQSFNGLKIICGATTGDIISRELGEKITDSFEFVDPELPPIAYMPGIDLITEGILTLGKVNEILKKYDNNTRLDKGPADQIVKYLLESDDITMIIGTKINIAHQDPNLPVELEIRRTVVKRIARLLEEKFLKEVTLTYL
jgi:hypothetical protein